LTQRRYRLKWRRHAVPIACRPLINNRRSWVMDRYIAKGRMARIEDGKGTLLKVNQGVLWITQERDLRDYFVRAGQSFRMDRRGVTLVYALDDARFALSAPASPKGGWLARLWTNAYSPLSRPTTAGL
jgi:hypothetical protein